MGRIKEILVIIAAIDKIRSISLSYRAHRGSSLHSQQAEPLPHCQSLLMSTSDVPADVIQRVLFVASSVHVYNIPPLTSTKGYSAASWKVDNNKRQIFTARLRVIEDAVPLPDGSGEKLSTNVLLEDPANGQLFAAAPYASPTSVEAAIDSSRFFAIRVVGEGGMKATLGIGFEERSDAIDFGIALQEARKVHHMEAGSQAPRKGGTAPRLEVKKDYSLKAGETIHVDIGSSGRRKRVYADTPEEGQEKQALFSLAPPPKGREGQETLPFLPPPPSSSSMKAEKRRSRTDIPPQGDLGFDDGEFGEFQ